MIFLQLYLSFFLISSLTLPFPPHPSFFSMCLSFSIYLPLSLSLFLSFTVLFLLYLYPFQGPLLLFYQIENVLQSEIIKFQNGMSTAVHLIFFNIKAVIGFSTEIAIKSFYLNDLTQCQYKTDLKVVSSNPFIGGKPLCKT